MVQRLLSPRAGRSFLCLDRPLFNFMLQSKVCASFFIPRKTALVVWYRKVTFLGKSHFSSLFMLLQLYSCQQRWSDLAFQRLWHNWWFLLQQRRASLTLVWQKNWGLRKLSTKNQQVSSPVPLACRQLPLAGSLSKERQLSAEESLGNGSQESETAAQAKRRCPWGKAGKRWKSLAEWRQGMMAAVSNTCVWVVRRLGIIYPKVAARSRFQVSHNSNVIFRNLLFRPYFQRQIQANAIFWDQREWSAVKCQVIVSERLSLPRQTMQCARGKPSEWTQGGSLSQWQWNIFHSRAVIAESSFILWRGKKATGAWQKET